MKDIARPIKKYFTWPTALLAVALITGCGGGKWNSSDQPATEAPVVPTVLSSTPMAGATGVAAASDVNATFSAPMAAASFEETSFTLAGPDGTAVAGTISYSEADMIATLDPTADLATSTTYTATFTTAVQTEAGEALANDHTWTFTTMDAVVVPTVTSFNPIAQASNVAISTAVNATFSAPMLDTSLNDTSFTLTGPDSAAVAGTISYSAANMTATFDPMGDLSHSTLYTATITTDAQTEEGVALAEDHIWTFATVDAPVAPTVTASNPMADATAVSIATSVNATFSAPMAEATIDDVTFTLTGPDNVAVVGVISYLAANKTATFNPTADLAPGTTYTAVITTGAQAETGEMLASNHIWTFTTAAMEAPPVFITVNGNNPMDGATGVCINKSVSATFSEQIDPTTIVSPSINFSLAAAMNLIDGEVALDASGTIATFKLTAQLNPNIAYTATITTDVQDLNGNSLETDAVWTFTTDDSICQEAVALGATEPYGVLSNTSVTLGGGPASTTGLRVDGNVGIFPAGACSGCDTTTVSGLMEIGTTAAEDAMTSLEEAYNDAVNRATNVCTLIDSGVLTTNPSAACGGNADGVFAPGLYWSGTSIAIPAGGTITLDGGNDNNAVFVFQSESTIDTIGGDTHMILINGAQAKNVYWVAKSSATIGGVDSDFSGTVLALIGITVNTGTEMNGRALARGAAVVVQDQAIINVPTE